MLSSLAKHYGFDINLPFEELPKTIQDVVLNGSVRKKSSSNMWMIGDITLRHQLFEGILVQYGAPL